LRTIETQRVWCVSVTSVPRAKPARGGQALRQRDRFGVSGEARLLAAQEAGRVGIRL